MALTLKLLEGHFAVCRLPAGSALPHWFVPGALSHVSWTDEELSIACDEAGVPIEAQCERGWRSLMLQGPFAFDLTGILAQVLLPLAEAKVGIFAVSTFDTDYVMVKQAQLATSLEALRAAGHTIRE
ncbi:ACT domain-containing protein [Pseudoxanthomonas sp.]|uniref:ACT domain-containing protein n=1 Tax=Pseudoxanthomonas sp. TaxID=1871049 RepID=UPI002613ECAA|nr:ACT domain-containing protein [Pseudoxanthomonas sp.]WDS35804.1 MAG: ACT domain-containing protein [Pseudoxanthomonas sp.]